MGKALEKPPAYKRLTNADRALILHLDAEGKTQVEIAQRIGCSQPTVSQWLAQCRDTSAQAKQYLRGRALHIARKAVNTGQAKEQVRILEGLGILQEQQQASFAVYVGRGATINLGQPQDTGEVIDALSPVPRNELAAENPS